jgi:hypothetical protein
MYGGDAHAARVGETTNGPWPAIGAHGREKIHQIVKSTFFVALAAAPGCIA